MLWTNSTDNFRSAFPLAAMIFVVATVTGCKSGSNPPVASSDRTPEPSGAVASNNPEEIYAFPDQSDAVPGPTVRDSHPDQHQVIRESFAGLYGVYKTYSASAATGVLREMQRFRGSPEAFVFMGHYFVSSDLVERSSESAADRRWLRVEADVATWPVDGSPSDHWVQGGDPVLSNVALLEDITTQVEKAAQLTCDYIERTRATIDMNRIKNTAAHQMLVKDQQGRVTSEYFRNDPWSQLDFNALEYRAASPHAELEEKGDILRVHCGSYELPPPGILHFSLELTGYYSFVKDQIISARVSNQVQSLE